MALTKYSSDVCPPIAPPVPVRECSLQVKMLKDLFRQALGDEGAVRVDINTIDGFQVRQTEGATGKTHTFYHTAEHLQLRTAVHVDTMWLHMCPGGLIVLAAASPSPPARCEARFDVPAAGM